MAELQAFFASNGALPWDWATVNCCLGPSDWIVANGLADPAADLRGTFTSDADCRAIVEAAGGVVALFGPRVVESGLKPADAPTQGCVGVIGAADNLHRQWAAVWDGARWQVRLQSGWVPFVARPLGIWVF